MAHQYRLRSQNVTRTVLQEIIEQASSAGHSVPVELAAFLVRITLLNPENGFKAEEAQTKQDIDRLVEIVVSRLVEPNASLDSLKLQLFFDMNYASREHWIEEQQRIIQNKIKPRVQNLSHRRPRTRDDLQEMYADIVHLLIVWSELGTPRDPTAIKDTTAALRSVFPQPELGSFLGLDDSKKGRQLQELKEIVAGIRLFNKDCKKGGKSIDESPGKLPMTALNILASLEDRLCSALEHAAWCLAVLEQVEPEQFEEGDYQLIWDLSLNARQEVAFLNTIKKDIAACQEDASCLQKQLVQLLTELHYSVEAHVAIPTVQVYPRFICLAVIWRGLHDLMIVTNLLNNLMLGLGEYTKGRRSVLDNGFLSKFDVVVQSDETRVTKEEAEMVVELPVGQFLQVEIRSAESMKNYDTVVFAHQGFCPVTLVERHLLVPGCRQKRFAFYKGRHFACSSPSALRRFSAQPQWYEDEILKFVKHQPELIQLLQLHAVIYPRKEKTSDKIGTSDFVETCSVPVQTETHPVKENLDSTYEWNEWQLRRRALLLANLQTKLTHSSQTDESHLRRENATQVFLPKHEGCQTLKETGVNSVNDHHFLSGLQGYRKGKPSTFKYIDFTQLDSLLPGH